MIPITEIPGTHHYEILLNALNFLHYLAFLHYFLSEKVTSSTERGGKELEVSRTVSNEKAE